MSIKYLEEKADSNLRKKDRRKPEQAMDRKIQKQRLRINRHR